LYAVGIQYAMLQGTYFVSVESNIIFHARSDSKLF